VAQVMGVEPAQVRVVTGNIGGSFGMKAAVYAEYVCALHAARALGRPVKWTDERSGSFVSDHHGRDHRVTAELALDADGTFLGKYRKMHIPDDPLYYEKFYFTPGDLGFPNFQTQYGKIGVQICWDQWYPEGSRVTALSGAQVIFYPTSIGWHPHEKAEFGAAQLDAWKTIQRAHAIANGVYVAVVNRVGFEGKPANGDPGLEFWGNSFVADPFGQITAEASNDKEEILVVECDPAKSEDTRRNWPFLRDRRIDAYGPILNRWLGE